MPEVLFQRVVLGMKEAFYITQMGALVKHENTIYFENKEKKVPLPIERIEELFLLAPVTISSQVLVEFGKRGIPIHFFDYYEYYKGTFYPKAQHIAGHVVVKQVEHYLDPEKRLYLAKEFVKGAISNIKSNLRSWNLPIPPEIDGALEKAKDAPDINTLMSHEGNARKKYYEVWDSKLGDFALSGRTRKPPRNEGNALLSFLNSLTYGHVLSQLYYTHLVPQVSFLHEPEERRFSLALDIAEIFKPLIAERIMMYLVSRKLITTNDFKEGSRGILLKEDSAKKVVKYYKERLNETIKHPRLKRHISYKSLMRLEAYKLEKHLVGIERYKSLKASW